MFVDVLPNLIALGLLSGLAGFVFARRPAPALWPCIAVFQVFLLSYVLGDAMTKLAGGMVEKHLGIILVYTGSLLGIGCWWTVTMRFAAMQGLRLTLAKKHWSRLINGLATAGWLFAATNPWHGLFLEPVLHGRNVYHTAWWIIVGGAYVLAVGSMLTYSWLIARADTPRDKHNAAIMLLAVAVPTAANASYGARGDWTPDPTVIGVCVYGVLMVWGASRTRLFDIAPVAYETLLRLERDAVMIAAPDGTLLFANPMAERLLGDEIHLRTDLFSALSRRLCRGERRDPMRPDELRAFLDSRSGVAGSPLRSVEGAWLQVELNRVSPRRRANGALTVRVRDITQHVLGQQALRRSEERFRVLFESAPLGIVAADAEGEVALINAAAVRILGVEPGDSDDRLNLLHDETMRRAGVSVLVERCAIQGETIGDELKYRTADGRKAELRVNLVAMRAFSEVASGVLLLIEDITEQRHAERDRRGYERRMMQTQKLESIGVLAGGIAHDFNNLLCAILVNAELGLKQVEAGSAVSENLEEIHAVSGHAADLVRQLLVYAGRQPAAREVIDCGEIARDLHKLLPTMVGKSVTILLEIEPNLPAVSGDPSQLRQLMMNLLINAAEAQNDRPGGILFELCSVDVAAEDVARWLIGGDGPAGPRVCIRVRDQGSGMDETTIGRILDPFFSTKESARGLGLAASTGVVRAHQAGLSVPVTLGVGSTFSVYLPVLPAEVLPVPAERLDEARPPWPEVTGNRVLVVDDEESVRQAARQALEAAGLSVVAVDGGEEALSVVGAQRDSIAAVLLDAFMPGMSGGETLRQLYRLAPEIPVILTSGNLDAAILHTGSARRAAAFLHKPFHVDELERSVRAVIASGSKRREGTRAS